MRTLTSTLLTLLLLTALLPARAAQAQYNGAYYTVQEGDTLYDIAWYFNTSLNELIALNPPADPDALAPGKVLLIPGYEDLQGEILRAQMPASETADTMRQGMREVVARLERRVS